MSSEWVSTTAACEELGITLRTLYRLIDEGQIAAFRMGRVFRIKREDLDAFIEGTRVEPGSLAHLYPDRKEARK
jgi:excisionase family DNA binding protein